MGGPLGSSRKYPYPYHGWHLGIPNALGGGGGGFFGLEFRMHRGWGGGVAGIGIPNA